MQLGRGVLQVDSGRLPQGSHVRGVSSLRRVRGSHKVSRSPQAVRSCQASKSSLNAVATPAEVADIPQAKYEAMLQSSEGRAELADRLGYRQIGAELPDNISLSTVIKSMPKDVFQVDDRKAWSAVALTVAAVSLSIFLISISPWYLLPFAWAFAGTAWTGMFVIGHDAGHRAFCKNKLLEDIVGTVMFMPLIYPFEPWRIKHNHHHAHTNKLVEDTAWHPVMKDAAEKWDPLTKALFKTFLGSPLKLWASVGHWAIWHFDLKLYTKGQRNRVLVSLAAVFAFALGVLPAVVALSGLSGLFKFWLMPWLGYHFWMSTFTVVHHTAAHIPFKPANEWNAAKAQLTGTVHCDFPKWVEILTHDINVHVPHHVASNIPWYNLRKATDSLRQNWGQYMTEATWNWRMMKHIFTELHFYDEHDNYRAFDHEEIEPFYAFQRRFLPDLARAGMKS